MHQSTHKSKFEIQLFMSKHKCIVNMCKACTKHETAKGIGG